MLLKKLVSVSLSQNNVLRAERADCVVRSPVSSTQRVAVTLMFSKQPVRISVGLSGTLTKASRLFSLQANADGQQSNGFRSFPRTPDLFFRPCNYTFFSCVGYLVSDCRTDVWMMNWEGVCGSGRSL
jgi:hypothetical protein